MNAVLITICIVASIAIVLSLIASMIKGVAKELMNHKGQLQQNLNDRMKEQDWKIIQMSMDRFFEQQARYDLKSIFEEEAANGNARSEEEAADGAKRSPSGASGQS